MHHSEGLVLFLAHDYTSPVQHFGDKYWTEPRELQLRSTGSSQCHVLNPYELSGLVFSPLNFTVIVMFLMQRCSLQSLAGVSVRHPQPPLECGHVLAYRLFFLFRPQGCPVHGLDRESCLPAQHHHVGGHPCASLWRSSFRILIPRSGSSFLVPDLTYKFITTQSSSTYHHFY